MMRLTCPQKRDPIVKLGSKEKKLGGRLSANQNIKPYEKGKPILTVPKEIAPIYDWDVY